jgi:Zn-dependent metalloprotease
MRTRSVLGTVLATLTTSALALGVPGPSYSQSATVEQAAAAARPVVTQGQAVQAADAFLAARGSAPFRAAGSDEFQRVAANPGSAGTFYVAYERTHHGLPVVGGDLVVAVDQSGKVAGRTSGQERTITLRSTRPATTRVQARTVAKRQVRKVERVTRPQLVVYAQGRPRLAWQTEVTGRRHGQPSRLVVWTNARTGQVIERFDRVRHGAGTGSYYGDVTIGTSGSGSSYEMVDGGHPGVQCGDQDGSPFTGPDDVWGNGSGTDLETACVDVMYAVGAEVDMLSAWLGRSGIKGDGTNYPAMVGLDDVNAYYDGSTTNFGHSDDGARNLAAIDIVAHENGHGIFETTPGGSSGGNETGGMNEATGDIFGALTEAYAANPNDPADYLVGEEADLVGQGPIRNMADPSAVGDPNCYSSAIPGTEVHAAAGPLNHWFVLLAEGSDASPTCNSSTVTGLGLQEAGKVFYNGLLLKTSSWTHADARVATLTAAETLYGAGDCTSFNEVKAAWDAVSVPAQSGEPTCGGGTDPDPDPEPGATTCEDASATGTTSAGASSYQPSADGITAGAGTIVGCLTGPSGADFDLYLQQWNGSTWTDVASSESATSTESISYAATAGTYRWEVYGYGGSGSFTLGYGVP